MNEGKLKIRARKHIFLRYADGVKRYRLWCPYSKFSKFLISKDITFNEYAMLSLRKEQFDEEDNPDIGENVEFVP